MTKEVLSFLEGMIMDEFPEELALAIAGGEFTMGRLRVRVFKVCMKLLDKQKEIDNG